LLDGHAGKRRSGAGHAQSGGQTFGPVASNRQGAGIGRSALDDRLVEQSGGGRSGQKSRHTHTPGRLAEQRDVSRVAAELVDVVPYPGQGGHLVGQAPVAAPRPVLSVQPRLTRIFECRMSEKAEQAEAVVDGDDHDIALARQQSAPVEGRGPGPRHEGTTVDPHHDRTTSGVEPGGPHVEIQAVLGELPRGPAQCLIHEALGLRGDRPEAVALTNARPWFGRHRRTPSPVTGRGCGIRDAAERPHPAALHALDQATPDLDHSMRHDDLQLGGKTADAPDNLPGVGPTRVPNMETNPTSNQ
jgi:hypothetical protein